MWRTRCRGEPLTVPEEYDALMGALIALERGEAVLGAPDRGVAGPPPAQR